MESALSRLRAGAASGRLVSYDLGHAVCCLEFTTPQGVVRLRAEFTRRIEAWTRWDVKDVCASIDSDGRVVLEDVGAGLRLVAGAVFVVDAEWAPVGEDDDDELPG